MAELTAPIIRTNRAYRLAVSSLFFLQGLCFSSWASRIPSIQQKLDLNEASLGLILLSLPVGSMLGLPFAGWLVTKFGSKKIAVTAMLVYSSLLILIGLANNPFTLITILVFFGIAGNISNIAINTQAVGVEEHYGRKIMASFHGMWSLAGFTGAGIGTILIGLELVPFWHFLLIAGFIITALAISFHNLLPHTTKAPTRNRLFTRPDKALFRPGMIAFCCMMCEGAMFDWSGIYFQKVVKARQEWIGAGYTVFMFTMAAGRFIADRVALRLGFFRTVQLSGLLIASGLALAVIFPHTATAIAGFFIVGFGVSSVVPLVYSEAGRSSGFSAGNALAAVSSIGFLGFLAGPPLIGMVAGVWGLRSSFLLIGFIGILIILTAKKKSIT